jgi:hypothetical protein
MIRSAARLLPAIVTLGLIQQVKADGIPEPSLVIYGVVSNVGAGGARMSFGTLNWVFQPAGGGPAITISTSLTNINDQFSYVLRIPCETEIPGIAISSGTLKLSSGGTSYDRSQITIEGVTPTFVQPAQSTLVLSPTDRGRIERIDLTVNLPGAVLPDAWQLQYFGHTGVDPYADPDHDGLNNLAEYMAGTNPNDAQSLFAFLSVSPDTPAGVQVVWSSVAGKLYTVQRSNNLLSGFATLRSHVAATAPQNTYHDSSATGSGPYFYRLLVEP